MDIVSILLISLGLAMDAFAVSISSGMAIKTLRLRHALLIASFFGAFQAIMPLLGWLMGMRLRGLIESVDHWVAFALLSAIGVKMIYEAFKIEDASRESDPLRIYVLFVLSIATSIDAMAVGLGFAVLDVDVFMPAAVIGAVTFVLSLAGVFMGERFGHFFEKKIEIAGGVILIAIGAKIVVEHVFSLT